MPYSCPFGNPEVAFAAVVDFREEPRDESLNLLD